MPKNVRLIVPYLPRAPQEYSASQFEKILNSLRLYFELVSAEFRSNLGDTEIDGDLTVSGTVTAPTFVGALTGNATTATLASTVTVTDSTANTDFPVAFHDESNALLDDTGVFEYNPSTGKLTVSQVDILKAGANEAVLRVGRNTNENLKITVDDPNVTILADQDSDSNGTHNFILNRVFGGTGLSNFTVQHDGNDEFTISDNGGTVTATFNSSVVINDNLLEIVSTDAGATVNPILSLYRNSSSPAASDDLGAIQFYGQDDGGNKTLYAQIHGFAQDETGGTEDGEIHFSCMAGALFEDPVMKLTKSSLQLNANNDLILGQNCIVRFETDGNDAHETTLYTVQATQDNTVLLPNNSGVLEIGALGSGAVVTGTSIAHAVFTNYRGQKVVFTGSSNCTIQLPDVAAGDVGATWTVCNAGSANVIFDLNGSGSAQTLKILTGAAVTTVGTDDPHIIPGGVASLVCTAADNYILFGSGVVDN